ncbi:MAG: hypothetical protein BWX66_02124 [Deltaproteobacteria bacterium ADurb.Bin058]|nr:MAG: hypothetical protein BWX66_02124 [Deltaproteobacteria bacterium ADurb.Bin058]
MNQSKVFCRTVGALRTGLTSSKAWRHNGSTLAVDIVGKLVVGVIQTTLQLFADAFTDEADRAHVAF